MSTFWNKIRKNRHTRTQRARKYDCMGNIKALSALVCQITSIFSLQIIHKIIPIFNAKTGFRCFYHNSTLIFWFCTQLTIRLGWCLVASMSSVWLNRRWNVTEKNRPIPRNSCFKICVLFKSEQQCHRYKYNPCHIVSLMMNHAFQHR